MLARATRLAFIGANVRRLRLSHGYTQEELAEATELTPRYVQLLEAGRANPVASIMMAIADVLGIEPGALFKRAAVPERRAGRPAAKRKTPARRHRG